MESKAGELTKADWKRWLWSALEWMGPLGVVYMTQLQGALQVGKFLEWSDLIPTQMTIGAMQLYVVNQLYGLFKRWKAES